MSDQHVHQVVIVGSGPAGYTAAIYAARAQLAPVLIEGAVTAGGALMNTTEVENYPGFAEGIQGPDLMTAMREQAERFGATILTQDATEVKLEGDIKEVTDDAGNVWRAKTVILAMGSGYRELGLPNEKRLSGHGVSWCATCDGFFFRGAHIAVIGGGDSAMEEATFLTRFAEKVTIVHRRDEFRASAIMAESPAIDSATGSPARRAPLTSRGSSSPSGTIRVRNWSRARWTSTMRGTSWCPDAPRRPTSTGCSPPGTWWITPTARRSRPPGVAALPPSMPNVTWPNTPDIPKPSRLGPNNEGDPCLPPRP
ncbi:MAG: FAD-dependent oxidoreductase [Candidatus Nanopelagicales bacterium]|nr:FAD-dependent oxidoreductase [Candidatus Nanopelagicales bacterium]